MTVHNPDVMALEVGTDDFPALAEASDGWQGTGTFTFRVVKRGEVAGRVTLELTDVSVQTENRADKSLKNMLARNEQPGEAETPDDDDGTDVV